LNPTPDFHDVIISLLGNDSEWSDGDLRWTPKSIVPGLTIVEREIRQQNDPAFNKTVWTYTVTCNEWQIVCARMINKKLSPYSLREQCFVDDLQISGSVAAFERDFVMLRVEFA